MTISDMVSYLGNATVFKFPSSEDSYPTRICHAGTSPLELVMNDVNSLIVRPSVCLPDSDTFSIFYSIRTMTVDRYWIASTSIVCGFSFLHVGGLWILDIEICTSKVTVTIDRARHKDIEFRGGIYNLQRAQKISFLHSRAQLLLAFTGDFFTITSRRFSFVTSPSSFTFYDMEAMHHTTSTFSSWQVDHHITRYYIVWSTRVSSS